jgi:hypothetical protein
LGQGAVIDVAHGRAVVGRTEGAAPRENLGPKALLIIPTYP